MPFDFATILTFDGFLLFNQENQYLIAVATPFIFTELAIYFYGILLGLDGVTPAATALLITSIIVYDCVIFYCARLLLRAETTTRILRSMRGRPLLRKGDDMLAAYEKKYREFPLIMLFFIKVLPFSKLFIFLYAFRNTVPFRVFVVKNTIATVAWSVLILLSGILVSFGLFTEETGQSLYMIAFAFIIFIMFTALFGRYIKRGFELLIEKMLL